MFTFRFLLSDDLLPAMSSVDDLQIVWTQIRHYNTSGLTWIQLFETLTPINLTGPQSAVVNVSGNRCESDCRSRGREIPARSHTLMEIDQEIISTVILLPSAESFKKGCCQLQAKVCARSTG